MRCDEDFTVSSVHDLGWHTITKEEIIAFAQEYDPQPVHVDETAAEEWMFGRLM